MEQRHKDTMRGQRKLFQLRVNTMTVAATSGPCRGGAIRKIKEVIGNYAKDALKEIRGL